VNLETGDDVQRLTTKARILVLPVSAVTAVRQDLQHLRMDAAKAGKWNIGFFAAGAVFWIFATIVGIAVDLHIARIYWLVGSFLIFPVAVLASSLFGADPFTKGNPLGELVGYTHMSVVAMSFPIVFGTFLFYPQALLLVMAIVYCLDFYVMSWAFGSRLFGVHAGIRVVVVTAIWFAEPNWRFTVLPGTVAVLYLITVAAIMLLQHQSRGQIA
jgi:hypothetical protein